MEISARDYAELVEDTVCYELECAVRNIARRVKADTGCPIDVDNVVGGFAFGALSTVRDQVIELLELNGMDVESDGRDW